MHLEICARSVKRHRLVTFRGFSGGHDISLTARPPISYHPIHFESDGDGLLHRDLIHHPPARQIDPVRIETADLKPGCLLLLAWMINWQEGQLEAVLLRQIFKYGVGLPPISAVVVNVCDFLALEFVQASFLLANVLYKGG